MREIAEIFFARVETAFEPFDPDIHAREDLTAFSASFSQVRGDAATIEIECIYPPEGLLSGPRWGIMSARIDGVVTEIARGQIVGYPAGLSGQTVTLELVCKAADASERVDNLFRSMDHLIPRHVEPSEDPRRSEPYLLSDVYHDPRTLTPSFDPIAGSADPVAEFWGEGAPADESNIFSLSIQITDTPISRVMLIETTVFREELWNSADIGNAIFQIPVDKRATYTPEGFRDACSSITLDGGYELKSTSADFLDVSPLTVYTEKAKVDWATCIKIPAKSVIYRKNQITALQMTTFLTAVQDRREILEIPIDLEIAAFGGAATAEEVSSLSDPESLAVTSRQMSYETYRNNAGIGGGTLTTTHQTTRFGVAATIWRAGASVRPVMLDCMRAMIRRAARSAIERAHCVQMTLLVHAGDAIGLTLRDRILILDDRIPSGAAFGKIVGLELQFGKSALATLIVACPISRPGHISTSDGSGLDGLAQIDIPSTLSDAGYISDTPQLAAARSGFVGDLVTEIELIDGVTEQEEACGGTDPVNVQIPDPEKVMPVTGLSMRLLDLSPVPIDDLDENRMRLNAVTIRLPQGVLL